MDWHERIASRRGEKTREGDRVEQSRTVASVSVDARSEMASYLAIYGPLSHWAATTLQIGDMFLGFILQNLII